MRVRFVHDDFIRVNVGTSGGSNHVVAVKKAMLTASCKSVDGTWSADDNIYRLNTKSDDAFDVILTTSATRKHHIAVHRIIDATSCELVHSVSVQGRTIALTGDALRFNVAGTASMAKHLIKKTCRVSRIACEPLLRQALPAYDTEQACQRVFEHIMVASEMAGRAPPPKRAVEIKTIGSDAFKLFHTYNSSVISKLTTAFPQHNLQYAQSLCLAVAFMANAVDAYTPALILAHTTQRIPLSETVAASLRGMTLDAIDSKTTRLSMLDDSNTVVYRQVYTLNTDAAHLLRSQNIHTRTKTPMYVTFDAQKNLILLADVKMTPGLAPSVNSLPDMTTTSGALAAMRFVNVAVAYHPTLEPRREVLHRYCVRMLNKPSIFVNSVFRMLRFEHGPALALLGAQDLLLTAN